jgi:hypothetical protein
MTEIAILREYQNNENVVRLNKLLQAEPTDAAQDYLINQIHKFQEAAMRQAGIGVRQFTFADGVFFDLTMDDETKITLLSEIGGQRERIEGLRR